MKKKVYNQPSVESAQLLSGSMVMNTSPALQFGEPITGGEGGD